MCSISRHLFRSSQRIGSALFALLARYVASSVISVHYPLPELETSRSIGHRDRSAHFVRTMKVNLVKGFPASSRRLSGGYRAYRLYTFIGFIGF